MNKSILLFAVASLLGAAAHAEDPSPFTANVSLTTNYKYRGQDQGNNKPAIQGGFDFSKSGFYIGSWNSSIGFTNAGLEMDVYGGYKGEITKDLTYDVGVLQYYYPQRDKVVDFNTTEIYGALSFGPATLKYSHTVSKDYFGWGGGVYKGRNTGYIDLAANFPIATGLTLNTHVGYTRYASELRDNVVAYDGTTLLPNYYDYKVGATYDLGSGFSIAGAIVGANKKAAYTDSTGFAYNKARFIATLTKSM